MKCPACNERQGTPLLALPAGYRDKAIFCSMNCAALWAVFMHQKALDLIRQRERLFDVAVRAVEFVERPPDESELYEACKELKEIDDEVVAAGGQSHGARKAEVWDDVVEIMKAWRRELTPAR